MTPSRMSRPGRNVVSGSVAARTSRPIPRTKPARRSVKAFVNMSRRLGERCFGFGEGPVEPGRERLDVGRLDGRAAPDTQARRRIAVMTEVETGTFLFEQAGELLGERRL